MKIRFSGWDEVLLLEMWIHASGTALCLKESPHVTYSLTCIFSRVLLDSADGIDTPMVFYVSGCWQMYWQHPETGQPADDSLQPSPGTHSPGSACKCCPSSAPVTKSLRFVLHWECNTQGWHFRLAEDKAYFDLSSNCSICPLKLRPSPGEVWIDLQPSLCPC